MNKNDLERLRLLSDLVADLSVGKMVVDNHILEAEFAAAIAQFSNLQSLTLRWYDVFNLSKLISPIQSQPASRFLTTVSFAHVRISVERASKISKAIKYNEKLKSFEARSIFRGNLNLVPILRSSHSLEKVALMYCLTAIEFFTLYRFFVKYEKLLLLKVCIDPGYKMFDKTYLKFGSMVAEKNVAQDLYFGHRHSASDDIQLMSYAEKLGGFNFVR